MAAAPPLPGSTNDPLADLRAAADAMRVRIHQYVFWSGVAGMLDRAAETMPTLKTPGQWMRFNEAVSVARNYLDSGGRV